MKVTFRYRAEAGRSVDRVDLLGEVSDWRNALTLERAVDGSFAREVTLPEGVYQYKLLVHSGDEARWVLDPESPRTRASGGHRNSVVSVDGAPEPLLFAAAAPWVEPLARGGLRILVGLRKPVADDAAIEVSFSEDGDATRSTARAERAFEEDEHVFFTATLPVSAPTVSLTLEAPAAGARFSTRFTRPPATERAPSWWSRATVYGIFVDRFRPEHDHDAWEADPDRHAYAGGHLEGIRRSLDELADLGIDTLYLTPVHVGASVHRYDIVDPLRVDPSLGGEAAYDALVADARARGMRVVQDVSFAHAGRGFPAYEEVLAEGRAAERASWFSWNERGLVHYDKRDDAPLFDLESPEVQALVLDTVAYWARRGASGLRLDMTAEVPIALGRRIRSRFRELVPDGIVFGEIVPLHAWRWRAERVVDAATDFAFHEIVTELVCSHDASAADAFARLAKLSLLRGGDERTHAVRFVSTHDHPRLATLAASRGREAAVPLAYVMLATLPGVPMLLYGEEIGMRSTGAERELEDVWPDRAPMPWSGPSRDASLRATVRALFRGRRDSVALTSGSLELVYADETTLVYRRAADGDVVDVALNFSPEPKTITLEDDEHPRLSAIAAVGGAEADGDSVCLGAFSAVVARRDRALGRAVALAAARRNLALRDRELEAGCTEVECRPSRFFFSITERCNLRCRHCITHAPERTKDGTARTMTPAVLDALRGELGYADYFAFVHGGESLTAPVLFDVLDAIRSGRGDEPYVAHLLTNGVLLGASNVERLVRAGVSSISVSLDGATAATNDGIREGGRFDDVCENVRRMLAWRRAEGVDLRVGLSFVLMRENVAELGAFVELGADLGVDWIKLEEGVPATPFAKRSLVSCAAPEIRAAVDAAVAAGRARGLVMVDHTVERELWRCRLSPEDRAFLEADEHANRCEIHPCRTPWETACVEPNGDVRVLDFFGPIVGNVTREPLSSLFNARAAVEARERAKRSRLCGPSGPVTCLGSATLVR